MKRLSLNHCEVSFLSGWLNRVRLCNTKDTIADQLRMRLTSSVENSRFPHITTIIRRNILLL